MYRKPANGNEQFEGTKTWVLSSLQGNSLEITLTVSLKTG